MTEYLLERARSQPQYRSLKNEVCEAFPIPKHVLKPYMLSDTFFKSL